MGWERRLPYRSTDPSQESASGGKRGNRAMVGKDIASHSMREGQDCWYFASRGFSRQLNSQTTLDLERLPVCKSKKSPSSATYSGSF